MPETTEVKSTAPVIIAEEQVFDAPVTFNVLPKQFVSKFVPGDTTPSVKNVNNWIAQNTGALNVTDFDNGQDGQHIYIIGDGQTTLVHGTNIFTASAANLLLAVNRVYHFVQFNGLWYEV